MSKKSKPDNQFQQFIKKFHHLFGILREEDVQTQEHKLLASSVQLDALIIFPLAFNFTLLHNRIFPFLSRFVIFEYKSEGDPLSVARYYQYSLTELGLITTRLMTYRRQDRGEWQSLSQKGARAQWQQLKAQGAKHSCSVVVLSTGDPIKLRETVGFEPVTEYEHLKGACHCKIILEDDFIGSVALYLVVLNELPVCPLNAPLLLLTTKQKKIEFCKWLLEDIPGIALEEKRSYLTYLLEHHLIDDKEVKTEIMSEMFGPPDHSWIFNYFNERPQEERDRFIRSFYENMLNAHTPQEVAQKALGANSPQEVAQKALGANSPQEVAQKALGANSPQEVAQKALGANSLQEVAQKALGANSLQEAAQKLLDADMAQQAALN